MTTNYVVQELPYQLGTFPTGSSASYGNPTGTYDYAFGGVPFLSAVDRERPLGRRTAEFRREQFDNSPEPGEQSLTGWWLRSQSSFHYGAGLRFEDPSEETNRWRFESSNGVDIWTSGQISLLPSTTLRKAGTTPVLAHGAVDGTTDIVLYSTATALHRVTSAADAAVTWGGSGNILSLADNGSSYYAADATSIYTGTLAGGAGAALWNTGNANVRIAWVKQRLMAGIGPSIYQLAGGAPPTLPTPTYTHPNSAWRWTSITEGPESIYISGYAGGRSAIVRLGLDTNGALPTLTQATTVAEMPSGEVIHAIYGYIGTYLAIGTSKGVRVAQVGSNGLLEVGPLIETPAAVKCLTAHANWVYAGYTNGMDDGTSGLLRIDTGAQLPTGTYAYAPDLMAHVTGEVSAVTTRGASGVLALAVDGSGLYETHATNLEATGFIRTPRIRYATLWPKLYKRLSIRTAPPYDGTVGITTIDQAENEVPLITAAADVDSNTDLTINYPQSPQTYMALLFTLNRKSGDATAGPTLSGYQLKAIPAGPRPRQLIVPLRCYDFEQDRAGVPTGYEGWALDRLQAMEDADSMGDLVTFQDIVSGESRLVLVEELRFEQHAPPVVHESSGGILTVICRTVD